LFELPFLLFGCLRLRFAFVLCCGGDFATTSTARSKRDHASGDNSTSLDGGALAMNFQSVLDDYLSLMESLKLRQSLVGDLMKDFRGLPLFCIAEIIDLQTRMICETIAVACLVAHGDVEGARSNRLSSAYQADFIMNALEKLHPSFYPRPTKQILKDGVVVGWEDMKEEYLTKADLIKTYRATAEFLHVGSVSELSTRRQARTLDLPAINAWFVKLTRLLTHHNIFLAEPMPSPGEAPIPPLLFPDGSPVPRRQLVILMSAYIPSRQVEQSLIQYLYAPKRRGIWRVPCPAKARISGSSISGSPPKIAA
jgi:hypothetical protein